ncbi:hypothetical protein Zm00014a_022198 [Zea mays]|uniref:Uncharacterized protein n=1 Tax=Zea mays TaxID=4577 RepID=A0A3L6EVH2_MAIZE|nr:hypothetical protein Zm00014a_022198 [Zea mays]
MAPPRRALLPKPRRATRIEWPNEHRKWIHTGAYSVSSPDHVGDAVRGGPITTARNS